MKSLRAFPLTLLLPAVLACVGNNETMGSVEVGSAVSLNGVQISYESRGKGGPVLVFVHGWAGDRSYWEAQCQHFSHSHRVVALDLAGHGGSGLNRTDWSIRHFSQDVIAVLDKLGDQEFILIGHSLGGPVVLEAAQLTNQVVAVIGVDTFLDVWKSWTGEGLDDFLKPFREDFPIATRNWAGKVMFIPSSNPEMTSRILTDMTSFPPEIGIGALTGLGAWAAGRFDSALANLRVPLGVIQTEALVPLLETVRSQSGTLPKLHVEPFPDAGHFLMVEDPARFNQVLDDTLIKLIG